jgi:hypothetical protein
MMYLNNYPCDVCKQPSAVMFYILGGKVQCTCADCRMQKIIDQMDFTDEDFYSRSRNERLRSMTYTQEGSYWSSQTS